MKKCKACLKTLSLSEFYRDKRKEDKRRNVCKKCVDNKCKVIENFKPINKNNYICRKCLIEKPLNEFTKDKHTKLGITTRCKKCVTENNKKPELIMYQYNYRHNPINKEKYRAREKYRLKNDIQFRLRKALRHRLKSVLRYKNKKKINSHIELLGCSSSELVKYLESQFQEGMTWENYGNFEGKWNIDHKISLSSVDLENIDDLKKVCHYSNLRPMWALENIKKGKNCFIE